NNANDATVANNTVMPINSNLYDTAQITAGDGLALTGTVTFNFFHNSTCTGTPATSQAGVALGTHSNATGALPAGSYGFQATYVAGSDPNHNDSPPSACEPFSVAKGTPSAATVLKNASGDTTIQNGSSMDINSCVYDTAQVTADDGLTLTGTVTFNFFHNSTCTGTPATSQTGVALGTHSNATGPLLTGDYGFQATYVAGSDPNHNNSPPSACEPFSVGKAVPGISTTPKPDSGDVGEVPNDTATLTPGASPPQGKTKFKPFGPDNAPCDAEGSPPLYTA